MSYKKVLPVESHEVLAWMGKQESIKFTKDGMSVPAEKQQELLASASRRGIAFLNMVRAFVLGMYTGLDPKLACCVKGGMQSALFLAAKTLAAGEKILQLSTEWCEALENTRANISLNDYSQPYETMIVEFPFNYDKLRIGPGPKAYPDFVAIHHDVVQQSLLLQCFLAGSVFDVVFLYKLDDTIESKFDEFLSAVHDQRSATQIQEHLYHCRTAINAMFAMTVESNWSQVPPSSTEMKARKALKRHLRGLGRAARAKAQFRLGTLPTYFAFNQNISAFEDRRTPEELVGIHSGNAKRPHWRRGHWRKQRIGDGRSESKNIWIKPILINSDRFVGDLKDTSVTYNT